MRASTTCSGNWVYAAYVRTFKDILSRKSSPLTDDTFDYSATTQKIQVTTDGFKDFFDVDSGMEEGVNCELLANDCSNALDGTEANGSTSLSTIGLTIDNDPNCACLGIVAGFNDDGNGAYCSDSWDSDPTWCYVSS